MSDQFTEESHKSGIQSSDTTETKRLPCWNAFMKKIYCENFFDSFFLYGGVEKEQETHGDLRPTDFYCIFLMTDNGVFNNLRNTSYPAPA